MGKEIERKFLVTGMPWVGQKGVRIIQGYLSLNPERTVRVRLVENKGVLTIKGKNKGAVRLEYEYSIPKFEAKELLENLCEGSLIEKMRYRLEVGEVVFEIDEFFGDNEGLIVAEVELKSEDQEFTKPEWLGEETTQDPRYFNSNLVSHPYKQWKESKE